MAITQMLNGISHLISCPRAAQALCVMFFLIPGYSSSFSNNNVARTGWAGATAEQSHG
jgi:hypothetical protein